MSLKSEEFERQRECRVRQIEDILQSYLPVQKGCQRIIMEAMTYSLLAGGKRIRPMLMKETFSQIGRAHV